MKTSNIKQRILIHFPVLIYFVLISSFVFGQGNARTEIRIPEIPGYVTLKCDFHMHTVFSDGLVWPTVRVGEAWKEGLNALAISDHIEYQPHRKDIPTDHNRPFEIALRSANSYDLILVRASEITRDMPPGHLNAIFLDDADPLDKKDYLNAIEAAVNQGAFVFWNHPGWKRQQPDTTLWWDEHTEIYDNGWLHGIEVVNDNDYYPEAHQWALDKNLTMLGNSDVHAPIDLIYNFSGGEHRPLTLVFAEEKSADALKEALFQHRTVVYYKNILIGKKEFLSPIFYGSVSVNKYSFPLTNWINLQIYNSSDLSYELVLDKENEDVSVPEFITLPAQKTVIFRISNKSDFSGKKTITLPYRVKNLLIEPGKGLPVEFKFNITFESLK